MPRLGAGEEPGVELSSSDMDDAVAEDVPIASFVSLMLQFSFGPCRTELGVDGPLHRNQVVRNDLLRPQDVADLVSAPVILGLLAALEAFDAEVVVA